MTPEELALKLLAQRLHQAIEAEIEGLVLIDPTLAQGLEEFMTAQLDQLALYAPAVPVPARPRSKRQAQRRPHV